VRGRRAPPGRRSRWGELAARLLRMDDPPERVAGGVAIGVAIGVAPTFGLGAFLAAGLAALFKRNLAAAMVGSVAGAPPFIFGAWLASAWIGAYIFNVDFQSLYASFRSGEALRAGGDLFLAYLAGNAIVTAVLTAASYVIVLRYLKARRGRV
jgi:uncharacterized protein (DUF2062 family)